jgi:hypothetical protein
LKTLVVWEGGWPGKEGLELGWAEVEAEVEKEKEKGKVEHVESGWYVLVFFICYKPVAMV